MFVSENLGVNEKGHLTAGGIDTVELAKQYGTPLYVMDEALIRKHCQSYKNSIDKFYGGEYRRVPAPAAFRHRLVRDVLSHRGSGDDQRRDVARGYSDDIQIQIGIHLDRK